MPSDSEQRALDQIKTYLDAGHSIDAVREAGWSDWVDHLEAQGYDLGTGRLKLAPPSEIPPPPPPPPAASPESPESAPDLSSEQIAQPATMPTPVPPAAATTVARVPTCERCGAERVENRPYCVRCAKKWTEETPVGVRANDAEQPASTRRQEDWEDDGSDYRAPIPAPKRRGSAFGGGFFGCLGALAALAVVGVVSIILFAWCISTIDVDDDGSILDDLGSLTDRRLTVEVSGTSGVQFTGSCLVTSGAGSASTKDIAGSVPTSQSFEGNLISCSFQKLQESGTLRGTLRSGDHLIEESSTTQPYGLVLVAGSP